MAVSIKWQRLVEDSETCSRCSSTEDELEEAAARLEESLAGLGIELTLEKEELSKSEFEENPRSSNLILINDRPLEDWIGGEAGRSECCDVCGDEDCRTVVVNGREYETVPSELIVRAGLAAASRLKEDGGCGCSSGGRSDGCCG